MPHMPPPHWPMPQPASRQGSSLVSLAEWAAGTLNDLFRCVLPQEGQTGFSCAPDQEFKIAPAILAGVFVNRHRIWPFRQSHGPIDNVEYSTIFLENGVWLDAKGQEPKN